MNLWMTPCRTCRHDLAAFESGELPPERAARVADHLAVCSACRTEWEALSTLCSLLEAAPPPVAEPAADAWARIEAQIAPPPAPTRPAALPGRLVPIAGALLTGAGVFAAVAVGLPKVAIRHRPAPAPTPAQVALATPVEIHSIANRPAPVTPKAVPAVLVRPAPRRKPAAPKVALRPRVDPFVSVEATPPRATEDWSAWDDGGGGGELRPPAPTVEIRSEPAPEVSEAVFASGIPTEPDVRGTPDPSLTERRPARTIDQRAATELETSARARGAMDSPLEAVERASRARRLFP